MIKDLCSRFKLWCKNSDPFENECNRLAELHIQNKAREEEWLKRVSSQERKELRDRFAMAALTGILSAGRDFTNNTALEAYEIADAMLKVRRL